MARIRRTQRAQRSLFNTTDETLPTATVAGRGQGSSEASAEVDAVLNTHPKRQRRIPNNSPSADQTARRGMLPPVILSPQKGTLYNRRASTSPERLPVLSSPRRRDPRIYLPDDNPPSPETDSRRFSVFNNLLKHPELTLEVSKNLDVEDLISLYAISKDFHLLVNSRFTSLIRAQTNAKAPESARIFIHRCYKNLCIRDPARRKNETKEDEIRMIPSFRWLRMILFRENVGNDILKALLAEGHRLPKCTTLVIKKLWFLIDISDNTRRIGLMHNKRFWSDNDIFIATLFFIKLDMRLTDPMTGNGEIGLRRMLLNQRSLSTLAKVLKREEMKTQIDMLQMIVRYNYTPRNRSGASNLGVPANQVGKLQYEGWGFRNTKFIPVDGLVAREGVRRKMNLQNQYIDMMIYGYINKRPPLYTFEDVRTPMPEPATEGKDDEGDGSSDDEPEGMEKAFFAGDSEDEAEEEAGGEEEETNFAEYHLNAGSGDAGAIFENITG